MTTSSDPFVQRVSENGRITKVGVDSILSDSFGSGVNLNGLGTECHGFCNSAEENWHKKKPLWGFNTEQLRKMLVGLQVA
jgi:hypothetical protein